ncbi:MAG: OmpH family outer membrane protein [Thermoanaerobaculia bacterium]
MKRFIPIAATFLLATAASTPALAQGAQKIGVIEVQRIVQESAVGKESLARVQKIQGGKQEELVRRQKELRDMEQKIQEQGKALSEDAMDKLQKDYQAKALDLKRFQDDAQRELEETQRKELSELEKRIMPVIDTVAKEQGFQLVFNKFQSGLLYADGGVDLTEAVITRFNTQITAAPAKGAPAKPVAAAPAPAPKGAAPAPKTPAPAPKKP